MLHCLSIFLILKSLKYRLSLIIHIQRVLGWSLYYRWETLHISIKASVQILIREQSPILSISCCYISCKRNFIVLNETEEPWSYDKTVVFVVFIRGFWLLDCGLLAIVIPLDANIWFSWLVTSLFYFCWVLAFNLSTSFWWKMLILMSYFVIETILRHEVRVFCILMSWMQPSQLLITNLYIITRIKCPIIFQSILTIKPNFLFIHIPSSLHRAHNLWTYLTL